MTDLGEIQSFLGLEIEGNRSCRTLFISQTQYIHRILHHHGMRDGNPVNSLGDPHIRLKKSSPTFEATDRESRRYQSAVRLLMSPMLGTRPDIFYAISNVSQYSTNPNPIHWTAVKRIFRYLAGTWNRGLYFGIQEMGMGFTEADWGSGADMKSIGRFTFLLNGAAISWSSKKQSTVALSSTEAEYMTLTQPTKGSIWLQVLLLDLGARKHIPEIAHILIDNQGALALAKNAEFHARSKHIDIRYYFIRDHLETGKIILSYCLTNENTADIFTKALPGPAFTKHNLGLGLIDRSILILQAEDTPPGNPAIGAPVRGGVVDSRSSPDSNTHNSAA